MKAFRAIISFVIFTSCKSSDTDISFSNSSTLTFNLVKASVDETINIHPSINTPNYVVDLSKGFDLDPVGKDSFIMIKEKVLPVSHEDSVIYYDSNDKSRVSRSMIISFDSIILVDKKKVKVITRKILSSDTIVIASLLLERKANSYVCIKCEELTQ
jgi:hypothetical protein